MSEIQDKGTFRTLRVLLCGVIRHLTADEQQNLWVGRTEQSPFGGSLTGDTAPTRGDSGRRQEQSAARRRDAKARVGIAEVQTWLGRFPLRELAVGRAGRVQPLCGNTVTARPHEGDHALSIRPEGQGPEVAPDQEPLQRVGQGSRRSFKLSLDAPVERRKLSCVGPSGRPAKVGGRMVDGSVGLLGREVFGATKYDHRRATPRDPENARLFHRTQRAIR
jgi:hypothetical protein